MQSCAILPFAMGSPCQEMSRDHVIAVIAWLLCQWLQARRELQPYAPQILTLETKLTSTSVACMPGACLAHAWCMPGAKPQDIATGFILVASAKGRFANNHLVPQVQPSQGVAWSRTKTIFNENIYVANGRNECTWIHSLPFHSIYITQIIRLRVRVMTSPRCSSTPISHMSKLSLWPSPRIISGAR